MEAPLAASEPETRSGALDQMLSKYVRVWIWSVVVGVNSGLSYSYIGLQNPRVWAALGALLLAVMVLGIIAAFLSWWMLLVHLRIALIPEFFGYEYPGDARYVDARTKRAARTLVQSYQYFIIAATARLLFALIDFAFQTIR